MRVSTLGFALSLLATSCSSGTNDTPPAQSMMQLTIAGTAYSGNAYINWPFPGVPFQPAITGNVKSGGQMGMIIFVFTTLPLAPGQLSVGDVGATDATASYTGPSGTTVSCNADPATHGTMTLTAFSKQQVAGTFSFITEGSTCPAPVEVSDGSFSFRPTMWFPNGGDPTALSDGGGGG
jgi:hypothetical protein